MADFFLFLPPDVILNIIARLPAKPLLRFRCVSRYWNHMLRDPNFMKLRSRKTIMLSVRNSLYLIRDDVPTDDISNSIVKQSFPYENLLKYTVPTIIGTFNGIVLLRYVYILVLYNPYTRVSKKLPVPPNPHGGCVYGFGYGVNSDDLKVVVFRGTSKICDVYNVKKSLWSTFKFNISISFESIAGTFTNGFLYWIAFYLNALIVLDLKNMLLSKINLPFKKVLGSSLLGTRNGYICALHQINETGFDMWVMKEHKQWSKMYSFKSPVNDTLGISSNALFVLDSGRILMVSRSTRNLFIYDPRKDVYNTLNIVATDKCLWRMHVKIKKEEARFEEWESSKSH